MKKEFLADQGMKVFLPQLCWIEDTEGPFIMY